MTLNDLEQFSGRMKCECCNNDGRIIGVYFYYSRSIL